jgi:rare lipoprotein A
MSKTRRAHIAVGVLTLMVPASAYALSSGSTPAYAGPATPSTLTITPARKTHKAHSRVSARFAVRPRAFEALGSEVVHVRGHLLPVFSGSLVRLEGLFGGHWRPLARTRTGPHGGFIVRYPTNGMGGQHRLRLLFRGNRFARLAHAGAGTLTVFSPMVASWYDDAGDTACGFHAYYGVANKSLPCGTKVTFDYHGRTVTATVDDRGPFVAGRDWDLNQNTAGALGFGGVDTVWASIH